MLVADRTVRPSRVYREDSNIAIGFLELEVPVDSLIITVEMKCRKKLDARIFFMPLWASSVDSSATREN
jgi:hypothetical protein